MKQYSQSEIVCPECNRSFKSPQGLHGHLRWVHGISAEKGTLAGHYGESSDVQELHERVEELKLRRRQKELERDIARDDGKGSADDLSQAVGLGNLADPVKEKLQSRAFGIEERKDWVGSLLSNPSGIREIVGAIRYVLGSDQKHASTISELASELGLSAPDLMQRLWSNNSKSMPSGTAIGGIDVSGLPAEVAVELVKEARQDARDKERIALFANLVEEIPRILDLRNNPGKAQKVVGKADSTPQTYVPRQLEARPVNGQGEVEEVAEPVEMQCSCGQILDITGVPIHAHVQCPACGQISKIVELDNPAPVRSLTEQELRSEEM